MASKIPDSRRENLADFLKFYSEFAFFFCFSPYRYTRDSSATSASFIAKSWWPQRILCAISSIMGYFWLFREVRLAVPKKEESRIPSRQFQVILSLCGTLIKTVTLRKLWFRPERFLKILNFIVDEDTPYKLPAVSTASSHGYLLTTQKKWCVVLICSVYSGISLLNFGMGRVLQTSGSSGSTINENGTVVNVTKGEAGYQEMDAPSWWRRIVETSEYNFFLASNTEQITFSSTTEIIIGIMGIIGFFQRQIMGSYCDLLVLMGVLTFWTATKSFAVILEESNDRLEQNPKLSNQKDDYISTAALMTKVQVVSLSYKKRLLQAGVIVGQQNAHRNLDSKWDDLEKYLRSLHILSSLMNSAFGSNVTLFLVESIVYYSTSFDQVFFENGPLFKDGAWARKLSITFFFLNACLILLVAADISHQMTSLKMWLSLEENRDQVPVDQLHVILNEVDSNLVAIKGSGIFPVTYPLLANMLSITVTYFIICVQA